MENVLNYILNQVAENKISKQDAKHMISELKEHKKEDTDIAIIGMACQFPDAKNVDEYWNNILNQVDSVKHFPDARKVFSDEEQKYADGGYMNGIDEFDPSIFRISPLEAKWMAPTHRLMLETAWTAIEDSGYAPKDFNNTNTGVYIGHDHTLGNDYRDYCIDKSENNPTITTGSYPAIISRRISYILNLKGPSIVVDTACSSGLVAVHTACNAVRSGECDTAIAGSVFLMTLGFNDKGMSAVETSESCQRSFEDRSNGTIWGEGVAALILKPLHKAIEDNDNIYAIIKGSGINNDGVSAGLSSPSAIAQEEVLANTWRRLKINPEDISYIEAHGTGTKIGDPIEITAMRNAFERFTKKKQFCAVGTVKPNIGHPVSSSGLASLIKVVMSLKNKVMAPTIHFDIPSRYIDFCDSPVFINDKLHKWESNGKPRIAGVSSFGFSGTNCHMLIQEAPERLIESVDKNKPNVLVLSGKDQEVLQNMIKNYIAYIDTKKNVALDEVCFTASVGRNHFESRVAIVANSINELKDKLTTCLQSELKTDDSKLIYFGEHKIVTMTEKVEKGDKLKISVNESIDLGRQAAKDVKALIEQNKDDKEILALIGERYVLGANIDWKNVQYEGEKRRRISIPTYPYKKKHFWSRIEKKSQFEVMNDSRIQGEIHPYLNICEADSISNTTYMTVFSSNKQWLLREHRIGGRGVVPATGIIEMIRCAAERYYGHNKIQICDTVFLNGIFVKDGSEIEIHTVLNKEEGYCSFILCSKQKERWLRHAEGKIYELLEEEKWVDIDKIRSRCILEGDVSQIRPKFYLTELGDRWDSIRQFQLGPDEALVRIELLDEFIDDFSNFIIHPALLDNALNLEIRTNPNNVYLPYSYGDFKFYGKMPAKFNSHIIYKHTLEEKKERLFFDVEIIDDEGKLLGEIKDYSIKKSQEQDIYAEKSELYFKTSWLQINFAKKKIFNKKQTLLLFRNENSLSQQILDKLRDTVDCVIEVVNGENYQEINEISFVVGASAEDYKRLFERLKDKEIVDIIHMMSLEKEQYAEYDLALLMDGMSRGIYSFFYIVRGLVETDFKGDMNITFITDYANEVTGKEDRLHPVNASLIGMGKVALTENTIPKFVCRCIDVDSNTNSDIVINEIFADDGAYAVAYRDGMRYVEEVLKIDVGKYPKVPFTVKTEGVYVIPGGLGAIGIEIARLLASKKRINICMINRTAMPERDKWNEILVENKDSHICHKINFIKFLEDAGSVVTCYQGDITNLKDMESVFKELREKYGKINGIIQAAGVAGLTMLVNKDEKAFTSVIAPKIIGTTILDLVTREDKLDFFVLLSSMMTLTGAPGQSDYTAGNAFLDAFAHYGSRFSNKITSIDWPVWSEIGMAVDNGFADNEDVNLFTALTTASAVRAFDEIMQYDLRRVIVGTFNSKCILLRDKRLFDRLQIKFASDIIADVQNIELNPNTSKEEKKVIIKGEVEYGYSDTEKTVAELWGAVFGMNEVDVNDSFFELGGNSLISIILQEKLEKVFHIKLDDTWSMEDYDTVLKIAEFLDK